MGAAPLNWLAKIGGDTLKTKAKLLSSAINELYDDGQCKIVAVVDNTADNGKTVLITTDDNKTYSGTIANKKCEFLLPPKTLYTVQKVSSGSAEFTTKVEAGYGDYILVHLDTGYVEVKQGDIVGLDYIKAATADNLKNKVPEANAVKELNGKLGNICENLKYDTAITNYDISTEAPSFGILVVRLETTASWYDYELKSLKTNVSRFYWHSEANGKDRITANIMVIKGETFTSSISNIGSVSYTFIPLKM